MTDRPILFSALMVRALLAETKTQTRRAINGVRMFDAEYDERWHPHVLPPGGSLPDVWSWWEGPSHGPSLYHTQKIRFAPGDRLYVREEYYQRGYWQPVPGAATKGGRQKWAFVPTGAISFDPPAAFRKGRHNADPFTVEWHKRLGRFMPRSASRLTLIVTDVRVERLQDISEADARDEGAEAVDFQRDDRLSNARRIDLAGIMSHRLGYEHLWNTINGRGSWDANPWVVAVSFGVVRANIDQVQA